MKTVNYLYSFLQLGIFVLSLFTEWYDILVYASTILTLLILLDKLGKGIVLRETIALYNAFIYLFVPLMGYIFYSEKNSVSLLYQRFMPVSKEVYFNLSLPAITGFIFFLCWPIKEKNADYGVALYAKLDKAKIQLEGNHRIGIILLVLGVLISNVINYLPQTFRYVFTLMYMSSFAGMLYVYFSKSFPFRNIIMGLFGLFIVIGSLNTGMFTILVYMGMTIFSFFFLKKRTALWKKLTVFSLAAFALLIIQSVKPEYRKKVWRQNEVSEGTFFLELAEKRMDNLDKFFSPNSLWPIYYRTNQGFQVAQVQKYMPSVRPFDNGKYLMIIISSAFVPRLLWPDKPMLGGKENMLYYAGRKIKGYVVDVGPLGQGYGSFGVNGAIIYMMIVGAFIRFAYKKVFSIGNQIPLLLFWLPVLFYEVSYSGENDTLQLLNSLVKTSFFLYILYKFIPRIFKPDMPRR